MKMKENYLYIGASITSALSFIENLIPILQVILLIISLVLTITGIIKSVIDKFNKNEAITEDITKGVEAIKTASQELENKIKEVNENDRRGKED